MGIVRRLNSQAGREPGADASAHAGEPSAESSEAQLVELARGGQLNAWTRLYHEHFERVYQFVGSMTGDACISEDLTQEVFARAYVALPRFDGRSKLFTWLCGIATNVVRKHWRYKARRGGQHVPVGPRTLPPSSPERADPERHEHRRQRAAALQAALETLPTHYREAFVLVALRELSPTEAATLLGISPGNVSVRVHRARARVRKQLARMGWLPKAPGGAR